MRIVLVVLAWLLVGIETNAMDHRDDTLIELAALSASSDAPVTDDVFLSKKDSVNLFQSAKKDTSSCHWAVDVGILCASTAVIGLFIGGLLAFMGCLPMPDLVYVPASPAPSTGVSPESPFENLNGSLATNLTEPNYWGNFSNNSIGNFTNTSLANITNATIIDHFNGTNFTNTSHHNSTNTTNGTTSPHHPGGYEEFVLEPLWGLCYTGAGFGGVAALACLITPIFCAIGCHINNNKGRHNSYLDELINKINQISDQDGPMLEEHLRTYDESLRLMKAQYLSSLNIAQALVIAKMNENKFKRQLLTGLYSSAVQKIYSDIYSLLANLPNSINGFHPTKALMQALGHNQELFYFLDQKISQYTVISNALLSRLVQLEQGYVGEGEKRKRRLVKTDSLWVKLVSGDKGYLTYTPSLLLLGRFFERLLEQKGCLMSKKEAKRSQALEQVVEIGQEGALNIELKWEHHENVAQLVHMIAHHNFPQLSSDNILGMMLLAQLYDIKKQMYFCEDYLLANMKDVPGLISAYEKGLEQNFDDDFLIRKIQFCNNFGLSRLKRYYLYDFARLVKNPPPDDYWTRRFSHLGEEDQAIVLSMNKLLPTVKLPEAQDDPKDQEQIQDPDLIEEI